MREFPSILLSEDAIATDTALAVIHSNISVVNYLRHSDVGDDELHPDAFASYCVDYYYNTVKEEGLASFIHKTKWDLDLIEIIQSGLLAINAVHLGLKHLLQENSAEETGSTLLHSSLQQLYFAHPPQRAKYE